MGIGPKNLIRIQDLCDKGALPPNAAILELGAQEIYCAGHEHFVADFSRHFVDKKAAGWNAKALSQDEVSALAKQGFSAPLFRACGFNYRALDIFDGDSVTLFDLNIQITPPELIGQFDLITNFGTTEHLINQYLAMRTLHELTKLGGVIYHDLPLGGYHTHGYFSYNPMFFQHLAQANSYEIMYHAYSRNSAESPAPEFMTRNGYSAPGWIDCGMEFVLRKTVDGAFRMPLETGTSLGLNPEVWGGGDPYGRLQGVRAQGEELRLDNISGWDLQKELFKRYRRRLLMAAGLAKDPRKAG
jgi:hypothetical protein